jgi:hypothetical protein
MVPSRSLRAMPIKKIRQRRHDQPQAFSDVHNFSPHRHSNMWNVRPAEGLNMLVMNFGWRGRLFAILFFHAAQNARMAL